MDTSPNSDRVEQVRHLFDETLEQPPDSRAGYLDQVCRDDHTLRREIEVLLEAFNDRDTNVRDILEGLPLAPYPPPDIPDEMTEIGPDALVGETVSHYQILEKLGTGGMGVVYKARDTTLGRLVALKFLPPHLTADEDAKARLIQEAKAASSLDHSNIAVIFEIAEDLNGHLFIAMAYYDGETLKEKLEGGPLPPSKALEYTLQLTEGLSRAHEAGILHRDIKPSNIMVTGRDVVKLLDFGLAKMADVSTLTRPGATPGTVAYMSPEQTRGDILDARTDVWSLGVVVYEMLTGQRPFAGDNTDIIIYGIRNDKPRSLPSLCPKAPRLLTKVVDRMLAKKRDDRYDSAGAILADLQAGQVRWWPRDVTRTKPVSIVLLPLVSMTRDPEQEWFTYGITDALITDLAKIGGLRIISVASAMHYKKTNKTPPQIAAELGVDYIVEGSVAKQEDSVKISARLIHAVQDEYFWAESYDRPFKDLLRLQGEIARTIAGQIRVEVTPQEERLLAVDRSVAPKSYELYLKGMYHMNRYTPDSIGLAIQHLHRAVNEDPNEPLAHAGLAMAYGMSSHASAPPPDAQESSRAAVERALALDENLAEVHLALSMVQIFNDWDIDAGIQSVERALELNPGLALAHVMHGFFIMLRGRMEETWSEWALGQELDPLEPLYKAWRSESIFLEGGSPDRAIEEALRALELSPDFPIALNTLGLAYAEKGMFEEAIAVHEKVGALTADYRLSLGETYAMAGNVGAALEIAAELEANPRVWDSWFLARIYNALGETDKVFHRLEDCYRQRHPYILWFRSPRNFGNLRDDPRFEDLSRRLNLLV